MTRIEIYVDKLERIQGFTVSGHTGFADRGSDVVCAGVSALAQTAILGLSHFLSLEPEIQIKEGYLKCMLPVRLDEDEMVKAQVILKTTCLGFESTKASYESYLIINKRRWS